MKTEPTKNDPPVESKTTDELVKRIGPVAALLVAFEQRVGCGFCDLHRDPTVARAWVYNWMWKGKRFSFLADERDFCYGDSSQAIDRLAERYCQELRYRLATRAEIVA